MLKIMGFPSRYVQGPGALEHAGSLLKDLEYKVPAILCDEIVRDVALPRLESNLRQHGLPIHLTLFPGEITLETIALCNAKIKNHKPDVVLGLGGGKAIDAAKAAAADLRVPIIVIPTIASNDAPTSRLIVIYDENHRVTAVEFLKLNPLAVLVDTEIIVRAPPRFFAAGIGDAISKSLETHQCLASGGLNFFGTPPLGTAVLLADRCYEVILQHAVAAYDAACVHQVNADVEALVEATVLLSGLGFESGGLSLAHSLIRGITAVPSMSHRLHGEMVAFGALVQMVVEGRPGVELDRMLKVLSAVKLPVTFADLGYEGSMSSNDLRRIVDATLAHTYAKNMLPPLSDTTLADALIRANEFGARHGV